LKLSLWGKCEIHRVGKKRRGLQNDRQEAELLSLQRDQAEDCFPVELEAHHP